MPGDAKAELLERARRARRLAAQSTDAELVRSLLDLAATYEREAADQKGSTPTA